MPKKRHTFKQMARDYVVSIEGVLAPRTVKNYREALTVTERDARSLGLSLYPEEWLEREILMLKDRWVQRYAAITVATRFAALNGFLLHMDNGVIATMRSRRRLRLPKVVRGPVAWTDEDTANMLIHRSEGNMRLVLVLGYGLGLRREEIATLRLSDIRTGHLRVLGKGQKERHLPLDGWVLEELNHHLSRRGTRGPDRVLVYRVGRNRRGYKPAAIYRMVRRHGQRFGLHLTVHEMRRTFAQGLRTRGVDLEVIQELLGHESIETTRQYLEVGMERGREALRTLYASYLRRA